MNFKHLPKSALHIFVAVVALALALSSSMLATHPKIAYASRVGSPTCNTLTYDNWPNAMWAEGTNVYSWWWWNPSGSSPAYGASLASYSWSGGTVDACWNGGSAKVVGDCINGATPNITPWTDPSCLDVHSSFNGIRMGLAYQCVELAARYGWARFGIPPWYWGNAGTNYTNSSITSYFSTMGYYNQSSRNFTDDAGRVISPAPGDIVEMSSHIAIVTWYNSGSRTITVIEEDGSPTGVGNYTMTTTSSLRALFVP